MVVHRPRIMFSTSCVQRFWENQIWEIVCFEVLVSDGCPSAIAFTCGFVVRTHPGSASDSPDLLMHTYSDFMVSMFGSCPKEFNIGVHGFELGLAPSSQC